MAKRPDNPTATPQDQLAHAVARRFEATAGYKNVLDERGNAMLATNERHGPHSKTYEAIEERLKKADLQYERIKMALRRPISRWQVRGAVMALVTGGLALLEAPANKFLFDVALQSSGFVSYCVSAGITAFLLALAHFAGRSIRQVWSDVRQRVIWSNIVVFLICIGFASGIIGVLTVARAAFAAETGSIDALLSGIQGHVESLGPWGALVSALSDMSALVLACINLGGFVTTFVIAFKSHDSDRDYDDAFHAVEVEEKALARVHGEYLKERAATIKRFAPDLVGFAANYNSANSRVIERKTRLGLPLDDDDRFVLTDLDQMSEDAERAHQPDSPPDPPTAPAAPGARQDPSVASMRDYRRQAGSEAN